MSAYTYTANINLWSVPTFTKASSFFRTSSIEKDVRPLWIPTENSDIIEMGTTVSTEIDNPETAANGITPGWWSEDLTPDDIEISLMSREAVLAEIIAMGGSWADRPETIEAISTAHKAWGKKINELYADQDTSA